MNSIAFDKNTQNNKRGGEWEGGEKARCEEERKGQGDF